MKGVIQKAAALVAIAAALTGTGCTTTCGTGCSTSCGGPGCGGTGCGGTGGAGHGGGGHGATGPSHADWDLYDRCYPQRYWWTSRMAVNQAMSPQVQNGHVLDQTVWNWHFEPGSAALTEGGLAHLAYLARRRPQPDCTLYLQTANDLRYDAACPDRLAGARQELDTLRVQSIQKFLVAHTAGRPIDFQVLIHDPGDPTQAAIPVGNSVTQMYLRYRGGLSNIAGGASGGGGGGGGAASAAR